ncbi:hypothetical protein TL16_g07239 [Triparma laevis f. inornata]|uniref:Altered inheritance of mitochondria protein 24, mitochondrial n=1 Tax=Triparma laevis f. inornata TaxID=1714386 RepID=A0A9W7EHH2_9STRA|nr:hypothetical protein TL16_g07239 [Triparma laevis f. inornata]
MIRSSVRTGNLISRASQRRYINTEDWACAPVASLPTITSPVDPSLPPTLAIDFEVQCEIVGNDIQCLLATLRPNQILRTESASLLYSTNNVEMETSSGGGASEAFKRYVSGSNAFVTDFKYTGEENTTGQVCLGPDFPSKIEQLKLKDYDGELTCSKGSMVAMGVDVQLTPTVVKGITAGIFGGEGFIMQKLESTSPHAGVFIKGTGSIMRLELQPGENLRIATGALVAYTSSVLDFEVEMLKGVKNAIFGQGLFVTKIKNDTDTPGFVWVQGLESGKFVSEIGRRLGGAAGGAGMGMPLFMPMGGGGGGDESAAAAPVDGVGADAGGVPPPIDGSGINSELNSDLPPSSSLDDADSITADEDLDFGDNDTTSFDTGADSGSGASEESGGGLLNTLYDMFSDD